MTASQAEQGQRLLARLQSEMAAEAGMRQQLLSNQLQMLAQIQMQDCNAAPTQFDVSQIFGRGAKNLQSENMAEVLKEKIEEVENLFQVKEEKMKENYEDTIRNLEDRLEREQDRHRELSRKQIEEKEAMLENHKGEIQKLVQDGKEVQEALKDEYVSAIQKLKELRKIEQESVHEITSSASKLSEITDKVELNSKVMSDMQSKVDERRTEEIRRKERSLEEKERDLVALQEDLEKVKEQNEEEQRRKSESLAKLESELRIREAEQMAESKYLEKAKAEFHLEKSSFDESKNTLLASVEDEKERCQEKVKKTLEEVEAEKQSLEELKREVQMERARYHIHRRINQTDDVGINREGISAGEIQGAMQALDEEKQKLRTERSHLRDYKNRLVKSKKKLYGQRKDLVEAIEKMYEADLQLSERLQEIEGVGRKISNLRVQKSGEKEAGEDIERLLMEGIKEIQEGIVELLRQEQRSKAERISLAEERRKLIGTRNSGSSTVCPRCSTKNMRPFTSVQDISGLQDEEETVRRRPQAWLDDLALKTGFRPRSSVDGNFRPRSSGDGASNEILFSNVTALRKGADSDNQFLKNEMEYLKTIQQINMSTLSKYK